MGFLQGKLIKDLEEGKLPVMEYKLTIENDTLKRMAITIVIVAIIIILVITATKKL